MKASGVVAGWGAFNAALVVILVGYGGGTFEWALYSGSVILIWLVALAFLATQRRQPGYHSGSGGEIALLVGVAAIFVGLAFIYGPWLVIFAVWPLIAAVLRLRSG